MRNYYQKLFSHLQSGLMMSILQNGDFSDGLNGWTVSSPAGPTAPTHDPINNRVVFGRADNDVQNGDTLEQTVSLTAGTEYTLSFLMAEIGDSPFAGFGITVDLVRLLPDGTVTTDTQNIGSFQVGLDEVNNVNTTFVSNFDDAIFRIRGQFGFGTMESFLILDDFVLTCFTAGTIIETIDGQRAIETLSVDDQVLTVDDGPCPIRWIGSRTVTLAEMHARSALRPIEIRKHTFGHGQPFQRLVLSPAHRILLQSPKAELLVGENEVLASARSLSDLLEGVQDAPLDQSYTYFHLLFEKHQLVWANGLVTESFQPAFRSVSRSDEQTREELLALFPELLEAGPTPFSSARLQVKSYECAALLA